MKTSCRNGNEHETNLARPLRAASLRILGSGRLLSFAQVTAKCVFTRPRWKAEPRSVPESRSPQGDVHERWTPSAKLRYNVSWSAGPVVEVGVAGNGGLS